MGVDESSRSRSVDGQTSAPGLRGLVPFDTTARTRLIFGPGSLDRLESVLDPLGASRVLVVTDPGIARAGHLEAVVTRLGGVGRRVHAVFAGVRENPDTLCVDECLAVAREFRPDAFVGLGGGSSMDTAKACNFLLTNGGRMRDYWGVGKATRPMLPFVAIPTTAGTGSECQSAALISDADTHVKMACLDAKATACAAILDPVLTVSQPAGVTACTGIDALAHAVEAAVTTKRNPISAMYAREAFALSAPAFPRVLAYPSDVDARGRMLLGAALAGMAIEQSMLGAAHAAANPLTARFGTVHGVAVGLMLPHVVRLNAADPEARGIYAELALAAGLGRADDDAARLAEALAGHLEGLLDAATMPRTLRRLGVDEGLVPALAEEAGRQWTASFNPVRVVAADFERLYRGALGAV
ncbi:MAG: iron-containing alcohol dehydrogenase [Verrucomicrobiales bacterium]|nr:iron-containing alcohol dehydrogenase [Verrucomicrobiales bacterium]